MTYLVHWTAAHQDISVLNFPSKQTAMEYADTLPQDRTAHAIDDESDLTRESFSTSTLVKFYNAWADKPVTKFETRTAASTRVWSLMFLKFNNLPVIQPVEQKDSTTMPAWTIKIDGKKIGITAFETEAAAREVTVTEDPTVTVITSPLCLHSLTSDQLVAVYNRTKPAEKVKEFASKDDAADHVWDRLQSIPYAKPVQQNSVEEVTLPTDAPSAAVWTLQLNGKKIAIKAHETAETASEYAAATPETHVVSSEAEAGAVVFNYLQQNHNSIAPTVVKGKRVAQPREAGSFSPLRRGTGLERVVAVMDGTRTFEQIAIDAGITDGVAMDAAGKVRHIIKHVLKANHGILHTVDAAHCVKIVLPQGLTQEAIFR